MSEPIFLPVEDRADGVWCQVCNQAARVPYQATKVYVVDKVRYDTVFHTHKCPVCLYDLPTFEDIAINDEIWNNLTIEIHNAAQAALPGKLILRGTITVFVATVLMYLANLLLDNDAWYVFVFVGLNLIVGGIGIFMVYDGLKLQYKRIRNGKEKK